MSHPVRRSVDHTFLSFFEQRIWEQVFAAAFVELLAIKAPTPKRTLPEANFYQVLGDRRTELAEHAETVADEAIRGMRALDTIRRASAVVRKTA